jgi:PAS domain S-box-containing protein
LFLNKRIPTPRPVDKSPHKNPVQKNTPDYVRRNLYLLLVAFLLLGLSIGAIGYRHYVVQKSGIESEVRNQLAAVADLKIRQVADWRKERIADAKLIAAAETGPAMRQILAGRGSANVRAPILELMETLQQSSGYANAILINTQGRVCLAVGRVAGAEHLYATLMKELLRTGEITFSDFHYDEGLKTPHLGLNIPLRATPNGPIEGALLLGIDPTQFLYPLIQSWPTSSRTAETILLRREGDEVVYLNELRHRQGTALRLRFPLTDRWRLSVQAALGSEGVSDGLDYRGVPVLAATRKIPDSPWFLVAKLDSDEIYAPIHRQIFWLALIACSLTLTIGAAGALVVRDLRSRFFQEKHEAAMERRALLGHYDYLSRFANDVILLTDESGRITEANDRALAAYGYQRDELIGMPLRLLREATTLGDFDKQWKALEKEQSLLFETVHRRKDGTTFPVEVSARRIDVEGVIFRQSIIRDITDRKRSEEERSRLQAQLQQSQKMESIGRLAGGVAHDFNNLLTIIQGNAEMMSDPVMDDPVQEALSEIIKASKRAADLTRQLLAFSRKQVIEATVVDLNEIVVDGAGKMLQRLLGEDIEIITNLAPDLGKVLVDVGHMHQVLMNLAANARDAMPTGGKLIIETRNMELDEDFVAAHAGVCVGPYVLLAVSDTGIGLDEETRQRAFEPFFTTKRMGEGTGLGLATVYGIVKQSNGSIGIYSELGTGTTFKIYLPRFMEMHEPKKNARVSASALWGTETILVVEDQAEVRKLVAEGLKKYGYRVLEAASGEAALLLSERWPVQPPSLMVTDVVMPGMTGRDLAARFAPLLPEMKVLYMSGYTADIINVQGVLESGAAYLSKPFAPAVLAEKIRELLDERSGI